MKKIIITSLASILGTMAVTGGAVAVLSKMPNKLNISWGKSEVQSNPEDLEMIDKLTNAIKDQRDIILDKSSTISALEMEIEELNALLNPVEKRITIPEDLNFSGVTVYPVTEDLYLISSTGSSGNKGLYSVDLVTGEFIKITNLGYNHNCLRLNEDKLIFYSGSHFIVYDLMTKSIENSFSTNNASSPSVLCYEDYLVIKYENYTFSYNIETKTLLNSNITGLSLGMSGGKYSVRYGNEIFSSYNGNLHKFNLETAEGTITSVGYSFLFVELANGQVLRISTNSSTGGFAIYNQETGEFDTISTDVTLNSSTLYSTTYIDLGNGKYIINGSRSILYDSVAGTAVYLRPTETTYLGSVNVLKTFDNTMIIRSGSVLYSLDLTSFEIVQLIKLNTSSAHSGLIELPNGNMLVRLGTDYYYLNFETNTSYNLTFSTDYVFTSYTQIDENTYKLTTEDGNYSVIFNESSKVLYLIDIIF